MWEIRVFPDEDIKKRNTFPYSAQPIKTTKGQEETEMKQNEKLRCAPTQWPEGDLDELIFADEEPRISEK